MIYKGMEEATQGMIAMRAMQDVVTNNLANADTTGYQEDALVVSDFDEAYTAALDGQGVPAGYTPVGGGVTGDVRLLFKSVTKFSQGRLKQSSQPFDLALEGKGFFTVQARDGVHYTRNGSFSVDPKGYLITRDGGYVLGQQGRIQVKGNDFKVKPDGTILVDNKAVDQLKLTWVDGKDLAKIGTSDFKAINPMSWHATDRPKVMQGYLEMSNANPIKEMVKMLTIMRAFEAGQKLLQTEDQMAQKADQIGQPAK